MKRDYLKIFRLIFWACKNPRKAMQGLEAAMFSLRAKNFAQRNIFHNERSSSTSNKQLNPIKSYFDSYSEGNGIWKWNHYFDIYHRHFEKFRGKEVNIVEVGVYSGGSLEMWRKYFGPGCKVYGVDIQPECKLYERDGVKIFIGDQSDKLFWTEFKKEVPRIDILIDDGGHQPEQQIVTLEEILPVIRPGGVYLCEDVHGDWNHFTDYVNGLQKRLNHQHFINEKDLISLPNKFQSGVCSIHSYPFAFVIEKSAEATTRLFAPKHGTRWEPFL